MYFSLAILVGGLVMGARRRRCAWIGIGVIASMLASGCGPSGEATAQADRPAETAAPAAGVTDPVVFIRSVYERTAEDGPDESAENIYSERLRGLFADERRDAGGEVGRLEFNFWTNAQDDDVKSADVGSQDVEGRPDRRIVTASFVNIGRPSTIHYHFERAGGRWYLDDARNEGGKGQDDWPWTLSLILKYGDM